MCQRANFAEIRSGVVRKLDVLAHPLGSAWQVPGLDCVEDRQVFDE